MSSSPARTVRGVVAACALFGLAPTIFVAWPAASVPRTEQRPRRLDPAAWGDDHVGKPVPEYTTGDECLFCHREKIGSRWATNWHNKTVRPAEADAKEMAPLRESHTLKERAREVVYLLGGRYAANFVRPTADFGKLDVLAAACVRDDAGKTWRLAASNSASWDSARFAEKCAGCHASAVEPKTQAFAALSLDCTTCHGLVPETHTEHPARALLSPRSTQPARVTISICASCHARGGQSKSSGRPYSNNFVAGDNLFRDFAVDLSDARIAATADRDAHVLANIRDVVIAGNDEVTCLSCHAIHASSTRKHRLLGETTFCQTCHEAGEPKSATRTFARHNATCEY